MPNIKQPRVPRPSEDVKGPNHPETVNPSFNDPYRDKDGDTVGAGDYAGRQRPSGSRQSGGVLGGW